MGAVREVRLAGRRMLLGCQCNTVQLLVSRQCCRFDESGVLIGMVLVPLTLATNVVTLAADQSSYSQFLFWVSAACGAESIIISRDGWPEHTGAALRVSIAAAFIGSGATAAECCHVQAVLVAFRWMLRHGLTSLRQSFR